MSKNILLGDWETTMKWLIKIKHCSFEYNINNSQFFDHEMTDMRWLTKLLDWHVVTWVERLLWDDDWLRLICLLHTLLSIKWIWDDFEMTGELLWDDYEMVGR